MRRTVSLAPTLILSIVLGGGMAGCDGSDRPPNSLPTDGPIKSATPHGWSVTLTGGATFTDGMEVLHVRGDEPVKIEKVELTGAKGLELVGAKLVPPGRDFAFIDYRPTWPPSEESFAGLDVVDAVGAELAPPDHAASGKASGWELLLGLRATGSDGYSTRKGVAITYRVGGTRYVWRQQAELAACLGKDALVDGSCPTLT